MSRILDGKQIAAQLRRAIAQEVADLNGWTPGLAVVLVGADPASQIYVRAKARMAEEVGMRSFQFSLPESVSLDELLSVIARLNADDAVDGILVQLPLPEHIDARRILEAVDPCKDVDGFHPLNAGLVATSGAGIVPCTPTGCLLLLKSVCNQLAGLHAVVIGKSNIVGKPMARLLLQEGCTVTVVHLQSRGVADLVRQADIVVAAAGSPELVRGDWVKDGAIVVDVGINRIGSPGDRKRIVGDVAFDEVSRKSSAITPVPGGVGPMTIACLLQNTLNAGRARRGS